MNEYSFLFIHILKQFFMFVNYGDKVNQKKIRQNRILSNRKSLETLIS